MWPPWIQRRDVNCPGLPAKNGFSVIQSLQIASDDSKFFTCVPKSGGTVPVVQKVGVPVPLYPLNYAYVSTGLISANSSEISNSP